MLLTALMASVVLLSALPAVSLASCVLQHTAFWSLVSTGILAWAVAHFTGALVFSWETLGIVVLVLVITGGVLHLLIHFTKSEYSTPMAQPKAKPTPVKPKDS